MSTIAGTRIASHPRITHGAILGVAATVGFFVATAVMHAVLGATPVADARATDPSDMSLTLADLPKGFWLESRGVRTNEDVRRTNGTVESGRVTGYLAAFEAEQGESLVLVHALVSVFATDEDAGRSFLRSRARLERSTPGAPALTRGARGVTGLGAEAVAHLRDGPDGSSRSLLWHADGVLGFVLVSGAGTRDVDLAWLARVLAERQQRHIEQTLERL